MSGVKAQIHMFADASKDACGNVANLRMSHSDSVLTPFLLGKLRFKSLKPITIPRMDLAAASLTSKI